MNIISSSDIEAVINNRAPEAYVTCGEGLVMLANAGFVKYSGRGPSEYQQYILQAIDRLRDTTRMNHVISFPHLFLGLINLSSISHMEVARTEEEKAWGDKAIGYLETFVGLEPNFRLAYGLLIKAAVKTQKYGRLYDYSVALRVTFGDAYLIRIR